jgi:hypothetical protein
MIQRSQLTTRKGSLTNACIIEQNGKELLFSYNTLVGLETNGQCYHTRDGLASSRTTAKHISLWLGHRSSIQISESELQQMAE